MNKHDRLQTPNAYQRAKKATAATLGGLMILGGTTGNALAKTTKADSARRPAAAHIEHGYPTEKQEEAIWAHAVDVFAKHPQVLNVVIEYPLEKVEFPFYMDPWHKTLRVGDIGTPLGKKVDGVMWYPLFKRIKGVDMLMLQDKRLPTYGDVPPLESPQNNRYLSVKDVMKLHPTIYYGLDPSLPHVINGYIQTIKPGQNVQQPTAPYPYYPGRYVHAASYSNYQIGRLEDGYTKNGLTHGYGLVRVPDQNLEHFIHDH